MATKTKKPKASGERKLLKLNEVEAKRADQAYKLEIEGMQKMSHASRRYRMEYYWRMGAHTNTILDHPQQYGVHTVTEIAEEVGCDWRHDNLKKAIKFRKAVTKAQMLELQSCGHATWRIVCRWMGVRDPKARDVMYKDILAGRIKNANVDEELKKRLGAAKGKGRIPTKALNIFRKLEAQSKVVKTTLEWADRAVELVEGDEDLSSQRDTRAQLKSTLPALRALREELDAALKKLEAI